MIAGSSSARRIFTVAANLPGRSARWVVGPDLTTSREDLNPRLDERPELTWAGRLQERLPEHETALGHRVLAHFWPAGDVQPQRVIAGETLKPALTLGHDVVEAQGAALRLQALDEDQLLSPPVLEEGVPVRLTQGLARRSGL